MFTKLKNIDTAFRHIRMVTIAVVCGCLLTCVFALYKSFSIVAGMQQKVYILANGKALEAYASERKDNIPVEARDHVKTFHQLFFTLDPDDKVIKANITRALYLADQTAKQQYDDLTEKGYYSAIISGNISQSITVDSIQVDTDAYPHTFRCYAQQHIIRPTSTLRRSLITEGFLRNVSRSDNNPHGFLIERWATLENRDLDQQKR